MTATPVRAWLALAAAALLAAPAGAAESLTLESFLERISRGSGVAARFRETKELALLSEPLVSEGRLYFAPPDRLARYVDEPAASAMVIVGDTLRLRDAGGEDRVDLGESRAARQFVDNFLVLFNGDLERLRQRYELDFEADGLRWRLGLRPRVLPMRHLIARIEMRGEGPALYEMVTTEVEGDVTRTVFDDVRTDHRFTPEELARYFGDDG